MITISRLTITHEKDLRTLISDLSFTLNQGDKLAIIGEEGNGKSTLLKLIASPATPPPYIHYEGVVSAPGERIAYLPQEMPERDQALPVYALCAQSDAFLEAAPKALGALCAQLLLPPDIVYDDRAVGTLSGGEKIKLQLLLLLLQNPTCLLLDEPSNDLDLKTLHFLEHFLQTSPLKILYISHDETLLNVTATRILHLEQAYKKTTPRWTLKNLPYAEYMAQRENAIQRQEQQALFERREEKAQKERLNRIYNAVDHAQATISRSDPSGGRLLKKKMKAVKSLEKRYEREKEQQAMRPNIEYAMDAQFDSSISLPSGKTVLDFHTPVLYAGDKVVARDVSLFVRGPQKVFLVGQNGGGKTTLLRALHRELAPREDLRVAYMPQRYEDMLDDKKTPVEQLNTTGDKQTRTKIKTYLGALKFTREETEHCIGALSGGQKAKLLLLFMILSNANVLLLDEPTRNLSPLSAPVIRDILKRFGGAIICVTHDRLLLKSCADVIYELSPAGLSPVPLSVIVD